MKKNLQTQFYPGIGIRLICTGLLLLGLSMGATYAAAPSNLSLVKSSAARINVTGTVKDDKGEPLPGVSVKIKGTNSGTSTDVNGVFRLNLPTGNETLIFSFIGFKVREVAVAGRISFAITLQAEASALDEVVVVGYGTQKKIHMTGSIASVNVKEIEDIPVGNLSAALRGQLPAVSVSGGVNRPGETGTITIRNPIFYSKDGGSTEPLYIIDGAQRTSADFNLLDQSEIDNISILKDAAAAIYGILGSNGVVIVTTKRGKAGAPKISYSGSVGMSDAVMLPKMMNSLQLATYLNDAAQVNQSIGGHTIDEHGFIDGSSTNKLASYYTPDELDYFSNNSTNWLEQAWQTAYMTRHSLNASGGSEKATYFAGASYMNQNSNFSGVNTDRWTFRASANSKVTNGLSVGFSVSGDINKNKRYFFKQGSESLDNDIKSLTQVPQWQQYYYNGTPVLLTSSTSGSTENTNFFEIQKSDNYTLINNYVLNVLANVDYEVPFIKGLKASVAYNRNINNAFGKQYGTRFTFYQYSGLGENNHIPGGTLVKTVTLTNGDRVRLNPSITESNQFNGTLSYNRKFGKHEITGLALFEQYEMSLEGVAAEADGVIIGGKDYQNFTTGTQSSNQASLAKEYGREAYAGRINYSYADKYLIELAFRADANTNFAPGNQWGYFPSGSIGWVASEEDFVKDNLNFFDFLKFRASIGLLGNDSTKPFQYQENYKFETGKAAVIGTNGTLSNGDRGLVVDPNVAIANRNIQWDKNLKTNFGIDMQFLNSRLSVTADGFFEHRYNMLTTLSSAVPLTIGAAVPSENYSVVNTFGYELSLGWKDKIGKNWSYNFNPFLAWNDNKVIKTDQPVGNIGTYLDVIGQSSDQGVQGYHYLGMLRTQADVDALLASYQAKGFDPTKVTILGQKPAPGMLYYEDIRGPKDASGQYTAPDGKITSEDQMFLTDRASNHYSLGLNFGGSYKSLSLSVTMGMSFGGQSTIESDARSIATATSNRPEFWADHWTPENTDARYPSPYYNNSVNNVVSEFWFMNSFTFRVTNFNLSYTLPAKFTNKLGVGNVRAYLVGTNPLNFYNPYSYRDNSSTYLTYPTLKTYSFGLNVGF